MAIKHLNTLNLHIGSSINASCNPSRRQEKNLQSDKVCLSVSSESCLQQMVTAFHKLVAPFSKERRTSSSSATLALLKVLSYFVTSGRMDWILAEISIRSVS